MNKLAALAFVALSLTASLVGCADPESADETLASTHADLTLSEKADFSAVASLSRPTSKYTGTLAPYGRCERTYACRTTLGPTRWVLVESKSCTLHGYDRYLPIEYMEWMGGAAAAVDGDLAHFTVRVPDVANKVTSYDCAEATE